MFSRIYSPLIVLLAVCCCECLGLSFTSIVAKKGRKATVTDAWPKGVGEIVNGTVKRVEYGNVIVDLGRGEAIIELTKRPGTELGAMIAVSCDEHRVRGVIDGLDDVWVANLNSPRQTILAGTTDGSSLPPSALRSTIVARIPEHVTSACWPPLQRAVRLAPAVNRCKPC